jgi:CDP-4-dehydro-6-deoxyglucose reductase
MVKDYTAKLTKKEWKSDYTLIMNFESDIVVEFSAGQFINVILPSKVARAYSISSSENKKRSFEILFGYYPGGKASEYFKALNIGEEIKFKAPFGRFVLHGDNVANTIFVGTGTGIAPIKSMIDTLFENNKKNSNIFVLEGIRLHVDEGYEKEFLKYQEMGFLKYELWCSRESEEYTGKKGRVTEGLNKLEIDYKNTSVYICGNKEVVLSLKEYFEKKGVDPLKIYFERFN